VSEAIGMKKIAARRFLRLSFELLGKPASVPANRVSD
jgi:hypothetical protein